MNNKDTAHPDAPWLNSIRTSVETYLQNPHWINSPTSSITGGGAIEAAEDRFCQVLGIKHAIMFPSATYAMRAALAAHGVGPHDQVITPAFDWSANQAAVCSLGATPIHVPVSSDTLTLDPTATSAAVTGKTRAIIVTHTNGVPAAVPQLQALGLPVIEDFTGALGATFNHQHVGTMGTAGIMSTGPGKQLDTGEGAFLVTNDTNLYEHLIAHTMHPVRQTLNGQKGNNWCGFSIRVHPLAAVLALTQLETWEADKHRAAAYSTIRAARNAHIELLIGGPERTIATTWLQARLPTGLPIGFRSRPPGARILTNAGTQPSSLTDIHLITIL